jgi:hypothetical protein
MSSCNMRKTKFTKEVCWGRVSTRYLPTPPPVSKPSSCSISIKGIFLIFSALYSTASSAASQISQCRRMLGSNPPGQLRIRHWMSDDLTTRLDLICQIIKMKTCPLISFLYYLHVSRSEPERGGDTGHGQHSRQGLSLNQLSLSQTFRFLMTVYTLLGSWVWAT